MYIAIRYLPIPRGLLPPEARRPDGSRAETLVDISLLLYILNPTTTAEEEAVLRRLRAVRVPEPFVQPV